MPTPLIVPRYANAKLWGLHINGKVAWVTQELPALLIPLYLLWQGGAWRTYGQAPAGPRSIMTAAFLTHYAWRALGFPLLIRGGKPSSVVAWALALLFCVANGYLQVCACAGGAGRSTWGGRSSLLRGGLVGCAAAACVTAARRACAS